MSRGDGPPPRTTLAQLTLGDMREVLRRWPERSVHAVVTDPPYELGFMGKSWDASGIAFRADTWREVLRVLRPGGHALVFGGTRTFHRIAVALEDAGFELRDTLMWLYGSGFPKSLDVSKAIDKAAGMKREVIGQVVRSGKGAENPGAFAGNNVLTAPSSPEAKQWHGWGTALKPAWEPIIVARRPLEGTVAQNVLRWGCGALNIDGCRIPSERATGWAGGAAGGNTWNNENSGLCKPGEARPVQGRWPANLAHDGSLEVLAGFPGEAGAAAPVRRRNGDKFRSIYGAFAGDVDKEGSTYRGDSGSAARFFFACKSGYNEVWEGIHLPQETVNFADTHSSQLRRSVAFALVRVVNEALPAELHCSHVYLEPSMSATPIELSVISESVIETIRIFDARYLLELKPERLSLSLSRAHGAVQIDQTAIMQITISHWRSNGSAEPVIFSITLKNSEAGVKGFEQFTENRFKYYAKASRADRDDGCEHLPLQSSGMVSNTSGQHITRRDGGAPGPARNGHPTVKPTDLMRWLVRLVAAPGAVIADPFCGSGSTGRACALEGFDFLGVDEDKEGLYLPVAEARIRACGALVLRS